MRLQEKDCPQHPHEQGAQPSGEHQEGSSSGNVEDDCSHCGAQHLNTPHQDGRLELVQIDPGLLEDGHSVHDGYDEARPVLYQEQGDDDEHGHEGGFAKYFSTCLL